VKSNEVARKGKIMDICGPKKRCNVMHTLVGRLPSFLQEMNDINYDPQ
jgi:hypothetical protein